MTARPRVAVLGGAGRGIGAATARLLSASGVRVLVLDAFGRQDDTYPLASPDDRERLTADGIRCADVDLRDEAATGEAVDDWAAEHGGLDVVTCLAGAVTGGAPLWETPSSTLDTLWDSNTRTVWNLARAGVPHLLEVPADRRPTFVAVASTAATRGLYGLSAYVVAKHGTVGVVRALAADLAGTAVTAVGVAPGATDTTMLRRTAACYGIDDVAELAQGQLTRRPQQPEEVASVIAFASDCGPVVHGAILPADGGYGRV